MHSSFLGWMLPLLGWACLACGRDVSLNFYISTECKTASPITPSASLNLSTCVLTPGLVSLHYETVGCAGGGIVIPYLFKDTACGSKLSNLDSYSAGSGCLSGYASSTIAAIMLSCNQDRPEQPQATTTVSVNHVATGAPPTSTSSSATSGSGGKSNNDPSSKVGWSSLSQGTRIGIYVAAGAVAFCLCAAFYFRRWRNQNHPKMRLDQQDENSNGSYQNFPSWKVPDTTTEEMASPTSSHRAGSSRQHHMPLHSIPSVMTGADPSAPDTNGSGTSGPKSREDFRIAVFCAVVLEADAVIALFDHRWGKNGSPSVGKAQGDDNTYSTGAIGRHNIVLVHMSGMGKLYANAAAIKCRRSFPKIELALVVGICGVVPFGPKGNEIVLGDVVVSDEVVQYDFGRQLPDHFVLKATVQDSLPGPGFAVRALLAKLKGLQTGDQLNIAITRYLGDLRRDGRLEAEYPGTVLDRLFEAMYHHARDQTSCEELGCDGSLVQRKRLNADGQADLQPVVHYGLVASGDSVMKSAVVRDDLAKEKGVIAFEMEGAGVWGTFPCLVIKGACDYADSHKSKLWQRYAAATAAACMKAILSVDS